MSRSGIAGSEVCVFNLLTVSAALVLFLFVFLDLLICVSTLCLVILVSWRLEFGRTHRASGRIGLGAGSLVAASGPGCVMGVRHACPQPCTFTRGVLRLWRSKTLPLTGQLWPRKVHLAPAAGRSLPRWLYKGASLGGSLLRSLRAAGAPGSPGHWCPQRKGECLEKWQGHMWSFFSLTAFFSLLFTWELSVLGTL